MNLDAISKAIQDQPNSSSFRPPARSLARFVRCLDQHKFSFMATTETQKPKERELPQILPPKKKLETVLQKPEPSLPEHLDESANSSTRPYDSATDVPQKEGGEESKESGSVSAEAPMSSSAADAASVSDLQRKIRRAERFGTAVQLSEEEKRNSRAERFGTGSTLHVSDESKKLEDQKRKARAERFGLPAQSVADEEAKKKARLARFTPAVKTDSLEEDKKKARAIRFSQSPSDASSPVNGKKTAIVGKPHGGT